MTPQRSDIDKLWTELWTGGITNPLTAVEQISFLMFARLLDVAEAKRETKATRTRKPEERLFFSSKEQHLRWSRFKRKDASEMLRVVRDEVFPHLRRLGRGTTLAGAMKDVQLIIQKPSLLASVVSRIDALPLTDGDAKGDVYEYLLSKLTTAGINGQFRTPRHVVRFMVELVDPKPTETVADPACGTAGFLVGVMQYLVEKHTSPEGILRGDDGEAIYTGDLLEPHRRHVQGGMLHGWDFDATMLRIASMNLLLHGVESPNIHYQDTLSGAFFLGCPERASDCFDVILANPPFKGSLDADDVHASLTQTVKTKKTELLFLALVLRMLKRGGRSAAIVPGGVLFGSSKAHAALRRALVEENRLEGVIALPSGVFRPYAGVSTAILVFTKGGATGDVFFYDVEGDGFSLDDKRDPCGDEVGPLGPKGENDLYDALERFRSRGTMNGGGGGRTSKCFLVPVAEIREKRFDLSVSRYKETKHEDAPHEPPREVIARLRALEAAIDADLRALEEML